MTPNFKLTRRLTLQLLGSAALLPLALPLARAMAADTAGRVLILSDLHSAYEHSAHLLAALRSEIESHAVPHIIAINGDVFEAGNVVASRSAGRVDWALLAGLVALAPTVLNIGNHEPDFSDDLAKVVQQAQALGIAVVSNIVDSRTGAPYAPATASLKLGDRTVNVVGIATPALFTYPKPLRETLTLPDPVEWASANLADALAADGLDLVLSHAGVVADRAILPMLPDGTLIVGGHDHLLLTHEEGRSRYVHTGSWSNVYTVADIAADGAITITQTEVPADIAPDAELAALIEAMLAEHLTDAERAAIGQSETAMSLAETGRFVAATMANGAEADIGFVGHTTLGTGLPQGDVSQFAFNAIVRFDGKLMRAEVTAPVLAEILARANQDGAETLEQRTGDFLYAAPTDLPSKERYTIVTNDWAATNQKSYFGREDLVFTPGPEVMLKALVIEALN